jgi:hypothetical protein
MVYQSISGDDIALWAARIDAAAALPDLVRRLILATGQPQSILFRADGGTRYGGWDGTVDTTSAGSAFCPQGRSCWELSTEENVKKKLESDYKKRPADPSSTYVAVSGRRFSKMQDWAAQKDRRGEWARVLAFDADDLATWLTEAPSVAVWFAAEHLRRPVDDISTPAEFLSEWSNQTRPPLPQGLLLLGTERKRAAQAVAEWVARGPGQLAVSGATREEALRFAVAAIVATPEEAGFSGRLLVVRSERALRWAQRQRQSLILVPTLDAAGLLSSSNHHVVLAVDREGAQRADVEIGLVPYGLIEEELNRASIGEASRLARESGGSLPALLRLTGALGRPAWARTPTRVLLGLALAGEWTGGAADLTAVGSLTAATAVEIENSCVQLSRCADPPLRLHREWHGPASWRWSSPKDVWTALCPYLTDAALEQFRATAVDVLAEENPIFSLPHEARFLAPIHGKVLTHSPMLRLGLTRSLVRLSLSDESLGGLNRHRGSTLARSVVQTLLRPAWIAWASLSDVLPVLAEADPDAFLEALAQSLDLGEAGVAHLFSQEGNFSSPHTGLLWALERLGWSATRMPQVARALARLAQVDPGGRLSNRPSASLCNMLNTFRPSTNASVDERIATLKQLHGDFPIAAWPLTVRLASMLRGATVSSSNQPEFLPDFSETRTVSGPEFVQFGNAIADLLLLHVGTSIERWSELLKLRLALQSIRPSFFESLEAAIRSGQVTDPDQKLWREVRLALHQANYKKPDPADQARLRLETLYKALTPADPVRQVAWLFSPPFSIPEHLPGGWPEEQARLDDLRRAALTHLYDPSNLVGLRGLSASATQPLEVGVLLAKMPFADSLERVVMDLAREEWSVIRPGFFAVLAAARGLSWSEQHLVDLVSRDRLQEATQTARMLPWRPDTWDLIARVGMGLREAYWKARPILYPENKGDAERFVSELIGVGALGEAFNVASHYPSELTAELLLNLLDALSTNPSEIAKAEQGSWGAQQLFERLNTDSAVDDERLAGLELRYLPWLVEPGDEGPHNLRLFQALEKQPEFFAQLLAALYGPEGERADASTDDTPPAGEELERRRAAAQNAFSVLEAWTGYPGRDLEGADQAEYIANWTQKVLEATSTSRRATFGETALAEVLARVPAGTDGIWPCEAARTLIEQGRARFRDRLEVTKWTLRGVYNKGMFEGGGQEQSLAKPLREGAARLRQAYPETAAFLDSFADSYEHEAKKEDDRARDGRIDAGVDEDEGIAPSKEPKPDEDVAE